MKLKLLQRSQLLSINSQTVSRRQIPVKDTTTMQMLETLADLKCYADQLGSIQYLLIKKYG